MIQFILLLSLLTGYYCTENPDDTSGIFLSEGKSSFPKHFRNGRPADKKVFEQAPSNTNKVSEDSIEDSTEDEFVPSFSRSSDLKPVQDYSRGNFHSSGRVKYGQFKNPTTSKSELAYCSCCGRYFRDDDKMAPEAFRESNIPESATRESSRRVNLKQEGGFEKLPAFRPDKGRFKTQKVKYSEENYAVNLRNQKKDQFPDRRINLQRESSEDAQEPQNEPEVSSDDQTTSSEDIDISISDKRVNENGFKRKLDKNNDDKGYVVFRKSPAHEAKEIFDNEEIIEPVKLTRERLRIVSTPEAERFETFKENPDIQERNEDFNQPLLRSSSRSILSEFDSSTEKGTHHSRVDSTAVLKVDSPIIGNSKKLRVKTSMQKQMFNVSSQKKYADDTSLDESKGQGSLILHNIDDREDLNNLKDAIALKFGDTRKGTKTATVREKERFKPEKVNSHKKVNEDSKMKQDKKVSESNRVDQETGNEIEKFHEDSTKIINTKTQERGVKELTHFKKQGDVLFVHDTSRINKRNAQDTDYYSSSLFDSQPIYTYQESKHLSNLPKREAGNKKGSEKPKKRFQKDVSSSVLVKGSQLQGFGNYSRDLDIKRAIKGRFYE